MYAFVQYITISSGVKLNDFFIILLTHFVLLFLYTFISTLKHLVKHLPGIPPYDDNWPKCVVCSSPTEACFFSECDKCGVSLLEQTVELPDDAAMKVVTVTMWIKSHNDSLDCDQFVKAEVQKPLDAIFAVSPNVAKRGPTRDIFTCLFFVYFPHRTC
jgi:hypothetical protein